MKIRKYAPMMWDNYSLLIKLLNGLSSKMIG